MQDPKEVLLPLPRGRVRLIGAIADDIIAGVAARMRIRLPNRRAQRRREITFQPPGMGAPWTIYVDAGFIPAAPRKGGGRVVEVFLRGAGRTDSERNQFLDDLGVLISLLLQHGETTTTLLEHLASPDNDGRRYTIPGAVAEALADIQKEINATYVEFENSTDQEPSP